MHRITYLYASTFDSSKKHKKLSLSARVAPHCCGLMPAFRCMGECLYLIEARFDFRPVPTALSSFLVSFGTSQLVCFPCASVGALGGWLGGRRLATHRVDVVERRKGESFFMVVEAFLLRSRRGIPPHTAACLRSRATLRSDGLPEWGSWRFSDQLYIPAVVGFSNQYLLWSRYSIHLKRTMRMVRWFGFKFYFR